MTIPAGQPLYMLSFDQRASFKTGLLGIEGKPSDEQRRRVSQLKALVYEGFERALAAGAPRGECALLVDEEFAADVARAARARGYTFAIAVERSGEEEFDFEYGEDFGQHIEAFDPTFAKVLVRYNPYGDHELNSRQAGRLARLSDWLQKRDRKLLFELLVPATSAQLDQVGGDQDVYDRRLRPSLVVCAMAELQGSGVEPRVWKLEGLDAREDCERAVAQARSGGRGTVNCVVLGRGASAERVAYWLQQAASVRGYVGFAIGRTIWHEALSEHLADRLDRETTVARIAANYQQMIDVYTRAARSAREPVAPDPSR